MSTSALPTLDLDSLSLSPRDRVLVASANAEFRSLARARCEERLVTALEAVGGADALAKLEDGAAGTILLDRRLPDLDAEEVALRIRQQNPALRVLLIDSHNPGRAAGPAPAPLTPWRRRPQETPRAEPLPGMLGASPAMQRVFHLARLIALRDTTVLITGESGTGKEVVARGLHQLSGRAAQPWVVVNCAAIPEALLESELFGHTRGAFTGAVQASLGRVHAAHRGTLFLDEVGELPLGMQAKLLRFIQEGEVQRLGSSDVFRVDVRIVAATNSRLEQKVEQGLFRSDLYYRLAVFPLELPPLRERAGDVVLLARQFLAEFCRRDGAANKRFSREAETAIGAYAWPGNVRQLRHAIERGVILASGEPEIMPWHLPEEVCAIGNEH